MFHENRGIMEYGDRMWHITTLKVYQNYLSMLEKKERNHQWWRSLMRIIVRDVKHAFLSVLWIVSSQFHQISMSGLSFHQFKFGSTNAQVVRFVQEFALSLRGML